MHKTGFAVNNCRFNLMYDVFVFEISMQINQNGNEKRFKNRLIKSQNGLFEKKFKNFFK